MKHRLLVPSALFAIALIFLAQLFLTSPVSADDNLRIARLSFAEGTVQYQRPGQPWADASVNLPIQEGFNLKTADGYAEVEFENSFTMCIGTGSKVEFTKLALLNGGRATQITIPQGTAIISTKLGHADAVSVAAANLNINVPHDGRFRVDVSPQEAWVTVFRGRVEINPGSGAAARVLGAGATLYGDPSEANSLKSVRNASSDAFDKWVAKRENGIDSATAVIAQGFGSTDYSQGFGDLYAYGSWLQVPGMGQAWIPNDVDKTWTPFVNGRWQFMGRTGWNWVSSEPWGWVPYHFGSWVNVSGTGWAWLPSGASNGWRPAVASWVRVNDQLGWVADAPAQSAKSESIVILAAQVAPGVIRAEGRVQIGLPGTAARATPASSPQPPSPQSGASAQAANQTNLAIPPNAISTMLASFRSPGAPAAIQPQMARMTPNPPLMLAPRASALPANFQAPDSASSDGGLSYNLIKGECPCHVMTSEDMVDAQLPPQN